MSKVNTVEHLAAETRARQLLEIIIYLKRGVNTGLGFIKQPKNSQKTAKKRSSKSAMSGINAQCRDCQKNWAHDDDYTVIHG